MATDSASRVSREVVMALVLTATGVLLAEEATSKERVFRADGKLMLATGGRSTTLANECHHITFSSRNKVFFAYQDFHGSDDSLVVLETQPDGVLARRATVKGKEVSAVTAITNGVVLRKGRVFLDCHVNPSLSAGVEVNMESGTARFFKGHTFAWNRSTSRVAYFRDPSHGCWDRYVPTGVYIGARRVCRIPHRSGGSLRWVNDKTLQIRLEGRSTVIRARLGRNGAWKITRIEEDARTKGERHGTMRVRRGDKHRSRMRPAVSTKLADRGDNGDRARAVGLLPGSSSPAAESKVFGGDRGVGRLTSEGD